MEMFRRIEKRILSIDPTGRGFGYAVLEEIKNDESRLVAWGVVSCWRMRRENCRQVFTELLERIIPNILVVPEASGPRSRRSKRARAFLTFTKRIARRRKISVIAIGPEQIYKAFPNLPTRNKKELAKAIAGRFPELETELPPEKTAGESEHYRMAIFDAVGLAIWVLDVRRTAYPLSAGKTKPPI